jgi:hypothetical protein
VANEFIKDTYQPNSSFQVFSNKVLSKLDLPEVKPFVSFNFASNLIEIRNINFQNENVSIQIFNSLGELIHQESNLKSDKLYIDLGEINSANGYYYLIIKNNFNTYGFPFILAK